MATEAQVTANRRNAAKSTGPRTRQGKAVVAMNALKHGLCARQDVVLGEDPQEFERYRAGLLDDLSPLGDAECVLAQRFVGLSWRLRRAERLQNEVFDALLAKELAESMEDLPDELTPEDEQELMSDPSADPRLAIGRMIARDFAYERSLERLLTYERWIENCLYKTTRELRQFQLARASATHSSVETQHLASLDPMAMNNPCSAKQSQSAAETVVGTAHPTSGTDSAKQSQLRGSATGAGALPRCVRRVAWHSHGVPGSY